MEQLRTDRFERRPVQIEKLCRTTTRTVISRARGQMHAACHRRFKNPDAGSFSPMSKSEHFVTAIGRVSIHVAPGFRCGRMASSTLCDTFGEGRQVKT